MQKYKKCKQFTQPVNVKKGPAKEVMTNIGVKM